MRGSVFRPGIGTSRVSGTRACKPPGRRTCHALKNERDLVGFDGHDELSGSLLAAPGGRYRADLVDEDGDRELLICDGRPVGMPFPELLSPSWLLADFELEVTAETEYLGRAAYGVAGSPRLAGEGRTADRVTALIDAECRRQTRPGVHLGPSRSS